MIYSDLARDLADASHSGNDKIILHPLRTDRIISLFFNSKRSKFKYNSNLENTFERVNGNEFSESYVKKIYIIF